MAKFVVDATLGRFQRDLVDARQRHPSVVEDLSNTLERLADDPAIGAWIPNVGAEVRKVRVGVKKQNVGKSSGYRLIYLVERQAQIARLLCFHFKPKEALLRPDEIIAILKTMVPQGGGGSRDSSAKPNR